MHLNTHMTYINIHLGLIVPFIQMTNNTSTFSFKTLNKWGALGDELLDWEGRFQDCINGSENWFDVSAKGLLQYKECPGNPVVNWKHGGYRNLVDHLRVCIA